MAKKVVGYDHHKTYVKVIEENKGKHRENCLCWQDCKHFYPEPEDMAKNCKIARILFTLCVVFNIVTPVWECPIYGKKD